jgi:hypothetical protein
MKTRTGAEDLLAEHFLARAQVLQDPLRPVRHHARLMPRDHHNATTKAQFAEKRSTLYSTNEDQFSPASQRGDYHHRPPIKISFYVTNVVAFLGA